MSFAIFLKQGKGVRLFNKNLLPNLYVPTRFGKPTLIWVLVYSQGITYKFLGFVVDMWGGLSLLCFRNLVPFEGFDHYYGVPFDLAAFLQR